MEIQTQAAASAARQTAVPAAGSALSSDFQTFLKMLTTQMENQDPLNPIESSDFAVQLATFSGVEQQIRTNDLLADMVRGLGASGLSQLAGWVGMEARVDAPAWFDGTPISLAPSPDPASDAAELIVRDATGRIVAREPVSPAATGIEWPGIGSDGRTLPVGQYSFDLESRNRGQVTSVKPVEHYAAIREARLGADGVELVLAGGGAVDADAVTALRAPQG